MPVIESQFFRAECLEPALQRRVVTLQQHQKQSLTHILLVTSGGYFETTADEEELVLGPCLLVIPSDGRDRLRLEAGSRMHLVALSSTQLVDAFGDDPDGVSCRLCLTRPRKIIDMDAASLQAMEQQFRGLYQEQARGEQASWLVLSSHVRLLGAAIWRLAGAEPEFGSATDHLSLLQRFRQLVEREFRQQRPIAYYAHQLHVTPDRLHAVCTRQLRRSPLDLVHDRLLQEARLRLQRSALPVHIISDSLSFKDPAHFSRFFKRRTGHSPAQYRAILRAASERDAALANLEYHDWP